MNSRFSRREMVWLLGTVLAVVVLVLHASPVPAEKRSAVVVELFTSEGCSSCPPADTLLSKLEMEHASSANGTEIIALGFHVDYWDDQGWKDRFSSRDYTARQLQYATKFRKEPYTPQLVIDGENQLLGNDSQGAENAIVQAAAQQQQADVTLFWEAPDKLQVMATAADSKLHAQVMLAITEDDLTTSVTRGENGGHVLHHSAVVRELQILGELNHGRFQRRISVKPAKDWKLKDLRLIAFVQLVPMGPIEGSAIIPLVAAGHGDSTR
jgi:hypothetical protein